MKKAYMFRIYPNKNQDVILNMTLSTCRHLFNNSLAERKRQAELNRLKKSFDVFPWGKPEGRNRYNSFTYPQNGFSIKDGRLNISKIGAIKIILHREIEGKIKTCTIKKDIDHWYVSFSCGFFMGRDQMSAILIENKQISTELMPFKDISVKYQCSGTLRGREQFTKKL